MPSLETDYLVIGAGATGLAFTDALVGASDARVLLVDRRAAPGGHWNDAYPYVRLHQPSAYYGVNSLVLGHDGVDETGVNAGGYERATAPEVRDYFARALRDVLLPTGRVEYRPLVDYVGDGESRHAVAARLTGEVTEVSVRRRVVDARFNEPSIPFSHALPFGVDDATVIAPNDLVRTSGASGYT
ncbi:MAG: NAD(P)-binding protein, partial [Acidobacteriota bacterium]|nr:NAD(P)-binding protein [Acidobacteriota bacterium]